ncbi:hypothetical protein MalM25_14880 [Planctomycetes bacterium MalM25]|nr:hypothetical protein MalM25_14880 [Planctomycetes bacterium MalM25]
MKAIVSNRPMLLGASPLAAVAAPVVAMAWWLAGSEGLGVAVVGVLAAVVIYFASELFVALTGVAQPLERLMLGMLIRGGGGLAAVTAGVFAAGGEPKLVALVALPLYAALVVGEILTALSLQSAGPHSVGDGD